MNHAINNQIPHGMYLGGGIPDYARNAYPAQMEQAVMGAPVMSEIEGQVSRLANGLSMLDHAIDSLSVRLGPFICEPPVGKGDASPREVCGSPFGQQLQCQADRVHSLNARLEYLMTCLRV